MPMQRSILLALLGVLLAVVSYGAAQPPTGAGWTPIPDVFAPEVQNAAKFAVAEHNRQTGDSLTYLRVIRGESQQEAGGGVNYHLFVLAISSDRTRSVNTYDVLVHDKPLRLISFKL